MHIYTYMFTHVAHIAIDLLVVNHIVAIPLEHSVQAPQRSQTRSSATLRR